MDDKYPRIYVADLSAYNGGRLHGVWIELDEYTTETDIQQQIEAMLKASPFCDAEEWEIHDHEGFYGIDPSRYGFAELLKHVEMLREHGKAYGHYCTNQGSDATPEDFNDRYVGQYKSEEDFAYGLWQQEGKLEQLEKLGVLDCYIDWEAVAHDLFVNTYHSVEAAHEEVYVFTI
jgi:antirestriction protein